MDKGKKHSAIESHLFRVRFFCCLLRCFPSVCCSSQFLLLLSLSSLHLPKQLTLKSRDIPFQSTTLYHGWLQFYSHFISYSSLWITQCAFFSLSSCLHRFYVDATTADTSDSVSFSFIYFFLPLFRFECCIFRQRQFNCYNTICFIKGFH